MKLIFTLLVIFQVKHFLADYPLQRRWMLGKFLPGWRFVAPLAAHCFIHAMMTAVIVEAFTGKQLLATQLAFFDFAMHFVMDRIKASPNLLGRYKTLTAETAMLATPEQWRSSDRFWWSIGADQAVHHLTHYAIIYAIATTVR